MGKKSTAISDEAYSRLKRLKRPGESFPGIIERVGSQPTSHLTLLLRICIVVWGYCFAVWLYVVASQLLDPFSVYDRLAWWLPVRMDYIGEAACVSSFIFALIVAVRSNSEPAPPR
jgi:hypothetical protein